MTPTSFAALAVDLRKTLGAERTTVRLREGDQFPVVAESTAPGVRRVAGEPQIEGQRAATLQWILDRLATLVQDDCEHDEPAPPPHLLALYGVRSQIVAPVLYDGRVEGCISVHCTVPRVWTGAEVAEVERIAVATAAALDPAVTLEGDRVAIEQLVHRYAALCDQAYDPEGLAELFAPDAEWRSASPDGSVDFGLHQGRDAIRTFFASVSEGIEQTVHYVMNPSIEVAPGAATARGSWRSMTLMRRSGDSALTVLAGSYDHDYVRVDGRWLFARLHGSIAVDAGLQVARP